MTQNNQSADIVGGGVKKVLYTLSTVKRIGLRKSAKALKSNNTCKACGLGMGGQQGGMTNELDEFPSVCNKSIQAQSTDIQPAIPAEIFQHRVNDFKQLSGKEMESLGRLNNPIYKPAGSDRFQILDWPQALAIAAKAFRQTAAEKTFFYSSGRSSNEAGFVLQLLARLYGTNNVNNCSYYCHQATGVGLANTIGTGTATVELADLGGCDCVFVIGANPASNHPRFIHQLKKCRDRGGEVIVINPAKEPGLVKFAVPKSPGSMLKGGDWIASHYLQPHIGSDTTLLNGIAKALLEAEKTHSDYIAEFTNGFDDYKALLEKLSWQAITGQTGIESDHIKRLADVYARSENTVFAWGMGITHHRHGVENVEAISNLALLRGMIGKPAAGLLPLRGHSNVQGIGTIGVKPVLPEAVFKTMQNHFSISLPAAKGMDTLQCLTAANSCEIDTALIMGGNLFQATPNSDWAEQAFNRIGFKLYLTTTLNLGHVHGIDEGEALILPVAARDEEWQPTTQESMFNYVRLSDGGIKRLTNVRPESHILCDLAKAILPNSAIDFEAFKNHDSIREAIATIIPELAELKDIAIAKREFHVKNRLLHRPQFNTADGRARFAVHQPAIPKINNRYPFRLSSIRSEGQFNSIIYEEKDSYRGTQCRNALLIGAQDLLELGLEPGDEVTVTSSVGSLSMACHPFDLPKGNVMGYYPECNVLISTAHDPRSKTPAFKHIAVDIKAA